MQCTQKIYAKKKVDKMSKKKKNKKFVALTAEQQLDNLKARFGSDSLHVDVTLPMTASEVEAYFGQECKEFHHLCGCCLAWQQWHLTGKVTVTVDREEIIKIINQ